MVARVITDPRLLPYYLTLKQVAALCQFSPRTIQDYCARGIWQRGVHWTQPQRRRRFLRDGIVRWLDERDRQDRSAPLRCRANLERSPELAAMLERSAAQR
jgi:hypothetical protein